MGIIEEATFKYGLIVVNLDEIDDNGDTKVIHFAGYYNEPTDEDAILLRKELGEDEDFGLSQRIDELTISEAPEEIIEFYRDQYMEWIILQN